MMNTIYAKNPAYYSVLSILCLLFKVYSTLKALSHSAIFLANCKTILLLEDVKLATTGFHQNLVIYS